MMESILNFVKRITFILLSVSFFSCYVASSLAQGPAGQERENVDEIAKTLQSLVQYEIDGSFLLVQCMENVNNQALKDRLIKINEECEENIKELSSLIRKYGREAPAHSKDFKGFFMQGYAAMRGALSDKGAMKALHTNSQMILKAFESTLDMPLPEDAKDVIQKIYKKKKKTHEYIESQT